MNEKRVTRRDVLAGVGAGVGVVAVATGTASADESVRHVVGTRTPAAASAARRRANSVHRSFDFGDVGQAVAGRFPAEALDALRKNPNVRYVERDGLMRAIGQTLPWGVDRVDAEVADGETGGDGTDGEGGADIAIIDTGIDDDHPDLGANVGEGKAFVGCSGGNCNYDWSDDNDHGTHCAGIADAVDNGKGVVGVSTNATLHAVKVLDSQGSGSYSDVAAGIEWTADQGYDVASLSLGGSKSSVVEDACEYAYGKGVLLVAAAGNNGPCSDCVGYPAAEPECVAVSATTQDDTLASFSSTGPEVELAAPGKGIRSTVIGGYDTFDGTSMACPHVSGAGAQLMDNGYTNTEARDRLAATAEDIGLGGDQQGNGLLDVAAALGADSSDDLGGSNSAPVVDGLSAAEVETGDGDAEFDADWSVSDADGDLSSVDLTLTDDTDGETEDTASVSVSGDAASGTTRLVAAGDDGSGNGYTVEATVTDADGASDAASASVGETEDAVGASAPTVGSLSLSEDNAGGSPHAEFTASWSVSDADGDLSSVDLTLTDADTGATEDSASVDVGGSDAAGTTGLKARHDENNGHTYRVELVVTDAGGNAASDTATEAEDGS